jgi:hypothetical protein
MDKDQCVGGKTELGGRQMQQRGVGIIRRVYQQHDGRPY